MPLINLYFKGELKMFPYEKKFDHVVKMEKENGIATITLDCPQNMNRVTIQQIDELTNALEQANWDHDVRVIVLRGSGEVPFGPGDLEIIKTKLAKNLLEAREVMVEIADMLKKMYSLSKPIIGIADGGCMGGGCNVLLSCDIVIASDTAYFHELFVNFALSPDSGGLWALQRLVGPMKAKAICMCGDAIGANEAYEMGMVYKVYPIDRVHEEAYALAAKIASKSPVGVNHIKQISNKMHDYTLDTYFQIEGDYLSLGALSEDFKEVTIATMQKRIPQYKGY